MYSIKVVVFGQKSFLVAGLQREVDFATSGLTCSLEIKSKEMSIFDIKRPEINSIREDRRILVMEPFTGKGAYQYIKEYQ